MKRIMILAIGLLLALLSNAQDTTWRDTCYEYPIVVMPINPSMFVSPEKYGAISGDGLDDSEAITECFRKETNIDLTKEYDLFQPVLFNSRPGGNQTVVWGYGGTIVLHNATGFDFGAENSNKQIEHRLYWYGGTIEGLGLHFKLHAAYQARFQDLIIRDALIAFDLKWVMGSIFENIWFQKCQIGFLVGAINNRSSLQSTTINIRNNRWWTSNGISFVRSEGAHGFKITNNIVEGNGTARPYYFDMKNSGVGKLIQFEGNWFESPCEAGLTIANANGTNVEFNGNYFAAYVPLAIDAQEGNRTKLFVGVNHIPKPIKFKGVRSSHWTFAEKSQGHEERWTGSMPYWVKYTPERFISSGNLTP